MKTCILGTGFMGQTHARSLKQFTDIDIAAICGRSASSIEAMKSLVGLPEARAYTDFTSMLEAENPDVLYVCIPPFAHCGQVEAAAARGVNIFLEKPIALTLKRAESMTAAVEAAGVINQVGYHMRFLKSVQRMNALLASGAAGRPTQFQARYWTNMDGKEWWRNKDMSGGQIAEQVIHLYDLAMCFLGEPRKAWGYVANLCHSERKDYTIEDTSLGTVVFQNGAVASISGSNCALPNHFISDFRLVCENASLDYRSTGQFWVTPDSATIFNGGIAEEVVESGDCYLAETRHFLDCVRSSQPSGIPIRQGLESLQLIHTIITESNK